MVNHVWDEICLLFFFLKKKKKDLFLFLAVLDLCCYMGFYCSCGGCGLLCIVLHRLLIAVASLVAEYGGLGCVNFSCCSAWALEHRLSSCGGWA